jgi:ABC-2 type transport system ATP-binding protein
VPWNNREQNAWNIGVVFGQRSQLWWELPLDESFRLIGKMYGLDEARYRQNLAMLTELLGMGDFLATPVRQLSLGQRMRGDLAAAMLYEPPILFSTSQRWVSMWWPRSGCAPSLKRSTANAGRPWC